MPAGASSVPMSPGPFLLFLLLLLAPGCAAPLADPGPGIPRDFARRRAREIREPVCELRFRLRPGMEEVEVEGRVSFEAPRGRAVLDFGGSALEILAVDGAAPRPEAVRWDGAHLFLRDLDRRRGRHELRFRARSPVAATGTPLTRYRPPSESGEAGEEYLYTLLVPADARRLFPCFDQPDLKTRFRLELEAPASWLCTANAPVASRTQLGGGRVLHRFEETAPLPTYLFAFAAGPFAVVEDEAEGGVPLRILVRPSERPKLEAGRVLELHRRSLRWCRRTFGRAYPFGKLDLVLCPGFPYGGMEHAGAIFYRESALLADRPLTEVEELRRSTLIYHEVAHQWFGNLVTMEWFDDLWLKEGFATLMAYAALDELEPGRGAWLRFHQNVKPPALAVDASAGTVPVWQELPDLDRARSAYGPIVYNKAPAVLRELRARLGAEAFDAGVALYLQRHAFRNATWQDLVAALEEASGRPLGEWSEAWILSRGMPRVTLEREDGALLLRQVPAVPPEQRDGAGLGPPFRRTWPLAFDLLVQEAGGGRGLRRVVLEDASLRLDLGAAEAPLWILPNASDTAWGSFPLDPQSAAALLEAPPGRDEPFLRALAWSALWETVREAALDPRAFARAVLGELRSETEPPSLAAHLGRLRTCLRRYLPPEEAAPLRQELAALLRRRLEAEAGSPLGLLLLQELPAVAGEEELAFLAALALGERRLEGLEPGAREQAAILAALLAGRHPRAAEVEARLEERARQEDLGRELYAARAAAADPAVKERYYQEWLQPEEPPEQWIAAALGPFHWPGQEALTLPYLEPALERLPWVREHRRIFFLPAWIHAFVGAHASEEAAGIVQDYLEGHPGLRLDLKRKLEEARSELERALRVQRRWFPEG